MKETTLKFSGRLLEQLSQNIPSSLFALNELIKNAYDAFSPDIEIKLLHSKKIILIKDHGLGMGEEEIESLFHISKSTKSYGKEVELDGLKRITQGSKGLGFLSALKFGNEVKWITYKNGQKSTFSVNKTELTSKDDLSGINIPVNVEEEDGKGTEILIFSTENEIEELFSDLKNKKVVEKLAASIIDDSFDISIDLGDGSEVTSSRTLSSIYDESVSEQLFYITYNSKNGMIDFYHKGEFLKSYPYEASSEDYSISLELVVFFFGNGKNAKGISDLNKRVYDSQLYPLVYVNKNLFNNSILFDPELLRKKKSSEILPQMIGRVEILSESKDIEFNSDRTNFVENTLTKRMSIHLRELNKFIQTNGSALRKEITTSKNTPTGRAFPTDGEREKSNTAFILIDRKMPTSLYIPSDQIDLKEYVYDVRDSNGIDVNHEELEISVDGVFNKNGILASVEDVSQKEIIYRYNDKNTGLLSKSLVLNFNKKLSNITGEKLDRSIFTLESASEYKISMETVRDIINAINKVYSFKSKEDFLPIIACSIRSIFEISSESLFKKQSNWFGRIDISKLNANTKKEMRDKLLLSVVTVILLLKKNPKLVTIISETSGVNYSTLNNLLEVGRFRDSVKTSHVGAHQSTRYLSKPKIELCSDTCGYFAVICDILINISDEEYKELNVIKVIESDFQ
ncbi:ATP-binding protein [Enterovibrio baiacu]|uniref:ATP-binding protein n=1 Tax=Enterovibrio baiacu TaxID=2491023 RepID=UPI001012BEBE|nr:ATP-binding protein [Enterovibrio baiacu]MBE1277411.1 hypothetical protein [Enterovibrio baiacu]